MNGWICGTNRAFPDVTDGVPCCYGSVDDPGGCTCWKPVYAGQRQRRIRPAAPQVRQEGLPLSGENLYPYMKHGNPARGCRNCRRSNAARYRSKKRRDYMLRRFA